MTRERTPICVLASVQRSYAVRCCSLFALHTAYNQIPSALVPCLPLPSRTLALLFRRSMIEEAQQERQTKRRVGRVDSHMEACVVEEWLGVWAGTLDVEVARHVHVAGSQTSDMHIFASSVHLLVIPTCCPSLTRSSPAPLLVHFLSHLPFLPPSFKNNLVWRDNRS